MLFKRARARLTDWCGHLPSDGPLPPDLVARARAGQMETILTLTPHMMVVNIVNATIVAAFAAGHCDPLLLLAWYGLTVALGILGLAEWWARHHRPPRLRTSVISLIRLTRNAGLLGMLWGLLPVLLWPNAGPELRNIITALVAGMIGGGCLTLYVAPSAMTAWVAGILAGTLVALGLSGTLYDLILATLLSIYGLTLIRAGKAASVAFVNNRIASEKIKEQSETISMLLSDFSEGARDWLWETDPNGKIVRGGRQLLEHIGLPLALETDMLAPDALGANRRTLARLRWLFRSREPFRNLVAGFVGPEGAVWISLSGKPMRDEEGIFAGYRGVASDVTDIQKAEEQIAYLAWHDPLTGLMNRASFTKRLDICLEKPGHGRLFYLDLDGFKAVNDQFGHGMGDRLLGEVAQRLEKATGPDGMVARFGGDEFAILSIKARTRQQAAYLAKRVVDRVSKPYVIDGSILKISVSIGIAFADSGNRYTAEWLNRADLALYRTKDEGKAGYRFYEAAMDETLRRRRFIERELRASVDMDQITVAFQPFQDARDGRISGFEALARWTHPDLGDVPPAEFIPVAERIGMIGAIGNTVLRQACSFAANWPAGVKLAVNLSPQQLQAGSIVDYVTATLRETGLPAEWLELEITESTCLINTASVLNQIGELKALGVSISLDDFGTGYSALSYLLRFPFDKMKIDRSLVAPAVTDPAARDMLDTILKLAHVLGLNTTAEGVETDEQARLLTALGCDYLQGFGISRPLSAGKVPLFLLEAGQEGGRGVAPVTTAARAG